MTRDELLAKLRRCRNNGESLLDNCYSKEGWRFDVRASELDMGSGLDCILGQIFGDFETGQKALGLTDEECVEHGFLLPEGDFFYSLLTKVWLEVL